MRSFAPSFARGYGRARSLSRIRPSRYYFLYDRYYALCSSRKGSPRPHASLRSEHFPLIPQRPIIIRNIYAHSRKKTFYDVCQRLAAACHRIIANYATPYFGERGLERLLLSAVAACIICFTQFCLSFLPHFLTLIAAVLVRRGIG